MTRITHWMDRYIIVSWMVIAGASAVLAYWALDRTPPFALKNYTVFNSAAGQTAFVNASVERVLTRDCTVTFSRYLVDSQRIRHEIGGAQYMSSAALNQMEQDMPGALRLAIKLPMDMPVGPANLITALEYRCNPMHGLWPVEVLIQMKLEVLP